MENKIDLDAIIKLFDEPYTIIDDEARMRVKKMMIETAHQVLVLAGENAVAYYDNGTENCPAIVDKQSILDIEKIIC